MLVLSMSGKNSDCDSVTVESIFRATLFAKGTLATNTACLTDYQHSLQISRTATHDLQFGRTHQMQYPPYTLLPKKIYPIEGKHSCLRGISRRGDASLKLRIKLSSTCIMHKITGNFSTGSGNSLQSLPQRRTPPLLSIDKRHTWRRTRRSCPCPRGGPVHGGAP